MTTTFKKEQWEALVLEPDHWKRPRELSKGSPKLDQIDEGAIEDKIIRGGVVNLDRMETPLARFLKLMYTDQYTDFRERVLEEVGGIAGISEGVRDMVIDQTFRYFVMVEPDTEAAVWFAQVIVSIAVFRVSYGDGVINRLKDAIKFTKQNFFKKNISIAPTKTFADIDYKEIENIRYPAFMLEMIDNLGEVSHFRKHMIRNDDPERDLRIEHANLIKPLEQNKVHACVGDPERELYLHLVQLYAMYKSPDSKMTVYYHSSKAQGMQTIFNNLSPMMTIHANHPGPYSPSEADVYVLLTDEGVDMDLFKMLREALGTKLVAYSFKVGMETKKMKIPGGRVINTPWKPPHEPSCRMLWEPTDVDMVTVERSLIRTHHVIQDLFLRPFGRYETKLQNSKLWESKHLIRGEFDSEMEVYILEAANLKGVPEFLSADELTIPPRAIFFHPDFKRGMLREFVDFVLKRHTASVKNAMYADAFKCEKMGVFPSSKITDHVKSIHNVFGKTLKDGLKMFDEYMKLEGSSFGLVETIRIKNIFPAVSIKQSIMPEIISLFDGQIKKLDKMVAMEPYADDNLWDEVMDTFYRVRGKMNLVVLGETLGNPIHQFLSQYSFRDREIGEVIGEMGPLMDSIWSYVAPGVKYRSAKNIVEILDYLEESQTPFTVLVSGEYPEKVLRSLVKKYMGTVRLVGVYNMSERSWIPGSTYEIANRQDEFSEEAFKVGSWVRSCMCLGDSIDVSLSLRTDMSDLAIVVTDPAVSKNISPVIGRLKLNSIFANIYIEKRIDASLVTPTPGMVYDLVIVSPELTRDMSPKDLKNFIHRIREEVLVYTGEIKMLVKDKVAFELERMFPIRDIFIPEYPLEGDDTYLISIQRSLPSAVDRYRGVSINTGETVRAYNNFVKSKIISRFLDMFDQKTGGGRPYVLDLACGKGQDINKWRSDRYKIGMYTGIDGSAEEIDEARRRYKSIRGYKPNMQFGVDDVFNSGVWAARLSSKYDTVSCQLAIHYAFSTERTIKGFLHNVSQTLNMEGSLLVTTVDSEKIIEKINRATIFGNDVKVCREKYFAIEAGVNTIKAIGKKVEAGVDYVFTQFPDSDNPRTTTEFLVDQTYFDRLCREQGLEIVRRRNFKEYLSDEFTSKLDEDELKLIELYCSYEIVKVRPPEAPSAKTVSYVKKAYYDLTAGLMKRSLGKISDTLIYGPEYVKSFPTFSKAKTVTLLTQDIDFLRIPPGSTNVKIILESDLSNTTSYLKSQATYDMIYLPGNILAEMDREAIQNLLSVLKTGTGQITGSFVSTRTSFSGKVVFLTPDESSYILNGERYKYLDVDILKTLLKGLGARIDITKPDSLDADLAIFSTYTIHTGGTQIEPATSSEEEEVGGVVGGGKEDRFILSADQKKQKLPPGEIKINEHLSPSSSPDKYKDLRALGNWRQMLSDTWEGPEFAINENESFRSVDNAILHFKGRLKGVEGFDAFNAMNTEVALPEGKADRETFTKPFRAVSMTSKADKKALEEFRKIVYEAKFRMGEYREALMATRDAQLYINVNTRNELLEEVRDVIKAVVLK